MKFLPTPPSWSKNDIVFWSYSQKHIDSLNYKGNLYWAKSTIAVFDGEKFVDTYWFGGINFSFAPENIGDKFEVRYVGNFANLDKQNDYAKFEYLAKYYDDADIVDLNHSNNSSGNLYLRKGAKRSLTKIKERLESQINERKRTIEYEICCLKDEEEILANLNEETIQNLYF